MILVKHKPMKIKLLVTIFTGLAGDGHIPLNHTPQAGIDGSGCECVKLKPNPFYFNRLMFAGATANRCELQSSLDAVRLTSGQAHYRRMEYRLGPLQLKVNPGSEGLAGRSTWSQDAARHDPSQRVPSCDKESGLYGLTPTDSRQVFCIVTKMLFRVRPPCWALCVREGQGEKDEQ